MVENTHILKYSFTITKKIKQMCGCLYIGTNEWVFPRDQMGWMSYEDWAIDSSEPLTWMLISELV